MGSKVFWGALVFVAVLDLTIPFVLAPFYEGYSHRKMVMSSLGSVRNRLCGVYDAWMGLLGVVLCVGAVGLFFEFRDVSLGLSLLVFVSVLIFAVGACLASAFFPVGDGKEEVTKASVVHGFGSVSGFMALMSVPVWLGMLFYRQGDFVGVWVCSCSFVLAFISFLFFVMSDKEAFKGSFVDNEGLWQRLWLAFMYVPLVYVAVSRIII